MAVATSAAPRPRPPQEIVEFPWLHGAGWQPAVSKGTVKSQTQRVLSPELFGTFSDFVPARRNGAGFPGLCALGGYSRLRFPGEISEDRVAFEI